MTISNYTHLLAGAIKNLSHMNPLFLLSVIPLVNELSKLRTSFEKQIEDKIFGLNGNQETKQI